MDEVIFKGELPDFEEYGPLTYHEVQKLENINNQKRYLNGTYSSYLEKADDIVDSENLLVIN